YGRPRKERLGEARRRAGGRALRGELRWRPVEAPPGARRPRGAAPAALRLGGSPARSAEAPRRRHDLGGQAPDRNAGGAAGGVRGALPVPYGILCVGGGGVTSVLGAVFLDLHRRAIFDQRVLLERRRDQQLATLYDVTRTVTATLELQEVLRLVCQSVLHALGVERLWLFLRESPDGALRALAADRRYCQFA